MSGSKSNSDEENTLTKTLDAVLHPVSILVVLLLVIIVYVMNFYKLSVSSNPMEWGPFGDYIGGILNPSIALAALWWLRRSFAIQKIELAETRAALQDQADSQERSVRALNQQINNQLRLARIETLNIELNGIEAELAFYRESIIQISTMTADMSGCTQFIDVFTGEFINSGELPRRRAYLSRLLEMMKSVRDRKIELINEAQGIALKISGNEVKRLKEQKKWPLSEDDIERLSAAGAILPQDK